MSENLPFRNAWWYSKRPMRFCWEVLLECGDRLRCSAISGDGKPFFYAECPAHEGAQRCDEVWFLSPEQRYMYKGRS